MKRDRVHDGFEFVETIGPLAENVKQQINLTRRVFLQRHQ